MLGMDKLFQSFEREFEQCIKPHKVIRDAVHGDLWITELESKVIDTDVFQRLHRIRQLGPTYKLYPGAKHTRFEHSLGTLHIAQKIIDAINRNYESSANLDIRLSDYRMNSEDIFITRMVALLHDLAHMSFGHTLEDEGGLFEKKQWLDDKRREYLLEKVNPIIREYLRNKGISDWKITGILKEIEEILIAEEEGEDKTKALERPFIADIVGNTICADLLDYVKRDAHFTGLSLTYDMRIFSYFGIKKYEGKYRVVIILERRPKLTRKDILSSCIDLLKLRYSLAEKVYYHRVKAILSAMVIKMVDRAMRSGLIDKNDILLDGDDILLWKISRADGNSEDALAAKLIAQDFLKRNLFREVYRKDESTPTFKAIVKRFRNKEERYYFENFLRRAFSLKGIYEISEAGFIIYPPESYSGKAALTKVFAQHFPEPIQELQKLTNNSFPHYNAQIKAINNSYQYLWKFMVLLKKEDLDKLQGIGIDKDLIERTIEETLEGRKRSLVEVRTILNEKKTGKVISSEKRNKIINVIGNRPFEGDSIDIIKMIDEMLGE